MWTSPRVGSTSGESKAWTGRVVETSGLRTAVAEGWRRGPQDAPPGSPSEVGAVLVPLLEASAPPSGMLGV